MPDRHFTEPRLAEVYDDLDSDRSDLDHYAEIVAELGAQSVIDVGCGTGTFACRLALEGLDVIGVDPAVASLDVARAKDGAERVRWLEGDATVLTELDQAPGADLATMTANVAQVFLTDDEWLATLTAVRAALSPRGHLVFETRDPAKRAWEGWTKAATWQRVELPGGETLEAWVQVTDVAMPFVRFESFVNFSSDGASMRSESTLRFRQLEEIEASLVASGFQVTGVRDAPDRPGREFVFVAAVDGSH